MSRAGEVECEGTMTTLTDCNGSTVVYEEVDGLYYPPFGASKQVKAMKDFKFRDDDILLVNFLKSGTHWVWEMMNMLVHGKAEHIDGIKDSLFMEHALHEVIENQASPRLLNTHMKAPIFPQSLWDSNCKIVYTYRNPKDVAVSLYHHTFNLEPVYRYDGAWDGFLSLFLKGDTEYNHWGEHVLQWQERWRNCPDKFLVLAYEDVQIDPVGSVGKLGEFIGYPASEELQKGIAEKCQFDNMKFKNKDEPEEQWRDGKPKMYRKGKVGDWKNHFTVAQNEILDSAFTDYMKDIDLDIKFSI